MPDFADEGAELTDLALEHALLAHRNRKPRDEPNGVCRFCSTPIEKDQLFEPITLKPRFEMELDPLTQKEQVKLVDGKPVPAVGHVRLFCDEYCREDQERLDRAQKLR